jgi:hypothetical protein
MKRKTTSPSYVQEDKHDPTTWTTSRISGYIRSKYIAHVTKGSYSGDVAWQPPKRLA